MTTGERMRARRKEIGVPVDIVAKALNVSIATIYRYENGDIEKVPGSVLEPLAKILRTTPAYLMGWEPDSDTLPPNTNKENTPLPQQLTPQGEKIGKAYEKAPQREQGIVKQVLDPYMEEDEEDCINLPLYDEPAAAGVGSYLDVGHYEEQSFPSSIVPRLTDYCVRIAGDSMEPDIPHGSVVFVQASPVVENGEVGIFLLGNHSYCKRLLIEQEEKKILLTSDNPKYDDIEIDVTDSFNTLGKVLGVYDEDC